MSGEFSTLRLLDLVVSTGCTLLATFSLTCTSRMHLRTLVDHRRWATRHVDMVSGELLVHALRYVFVRMPQASLVH